MQHVNGGQEPTGVTPGASMEESHALSASYNNRGFLSEREGRLDDARREFELAIGMDPANAFALNNLGHLLILEGDLEAAMAMLRRAVTIDSSFAAAHNNLGNALLASGEPVKALEAFRTAVSLDPHNVAAQLNLAQTLHALGDLNRGKAAYERLLELAPRHARGLLQLGILLAAQSDLSHAAIRFEEALRSDPLQAEAWLNLAIIQLARKNFGSVLECCDKCLELRPELMRARYVRGLSHLACGDTAAALEDLEFVAESDPGSTEAAANLGVLYLSLRRFEDALPVFSSLVQREPCSARHHYHLAVALHGTGAPAAARSEYETCLTISDPAGDIHRQARSGLEVIS